MANVNITKRVIRETFLELLNERPLSKITVKDIADRCGINRNTFYYHYQDIAALIEEICSMGMERAVADYPSIQSLSDCLDVILTSAQENRRAIMHIYNSGNRSAYVSALWRICEHAVRTYVDTVVPAEDLSPKDRELIIRYHKCECFGMVIDWISNGMQQDLLEDLQRLCELRKGSTEELIRRSKLDKPE
ncbi:MAG: TetR/AcrR family transcriptional regulator C-terminal domain-containing protein [Oscillospiraceae bacterium]|nr:TetR/AcrR family transcriptional regulator C-terminal domain-containing protein [Oscillospiraceae bacterium]MBQ9046253.1 TetR/AcrR family transcriptional regulator C-terminal domain-containing protein [Oscillospiraceae bacterium]